MAARLPLASGPKPRLQSGEVPCVLGIDEAGRGPVLGPMSYAVAYWPEEENDVLKKLGFADSKALTEEKRERLFTTINNHESIGYKVTLLEAAYLSHAMFRKYNINALSHDTAIALIREVLYVFLVALFFLPRSLSFSLLFFFFFSFFSFFLFLWTRSF
jgi:hypothetical protein